MTQLGELRDAYARFQEAGIKLYAISYDEADALTDFAQANDIPYPLLSDSDSAVIRRYGILNSLVDESERPFYGMPYPGTYLINEDGVVTEKFFPRHLANRESAETLLESSLGALLMGHDEPGSTGGEDDIRIAAYLHGGGGKLKSGIRRKVVVRFELANGLHIYGEPVPDGMVATSVTVRGPNGLVVEETIYPPTEPLTLAELGVELQVWSDTVDIVVPVWANSHLIDVIGPSGQSSIKIDVELRYQACNERTCLIPRTETLTIDVPIDTLDAPDFPGFGFESQKVTTMDSVKHFDKLLTR